MSERGFMTNRAIEAAARRAEEKKMSVCGLCGVDPDVLRSATVDDGEPVVLAGHDCHCVTEDGKRVAVGICCGHSLGADVLAEEDAAAERRGKRG